MTTDPTPTARKHTPCKAGPGYVHYDPRMVEKCLICTPCTHATTTTRTKCDRCHTVLAAEATDPLAARVAEELARYDHWLKHQPETWEECHVKGSHDFNVSRYLDLAARALLPPADGSRVVGAVWCPCLPPGGWVCERCGQPVESEPCAEHMDPEGVMVYRPGVPCPDRPVPTTPGADR
jgi:hypothetical protein